MGANSNELVLSILSKKDSYGYEIAKIVTENSSGKINWNAASLYPVLKKLEEINCIESYWIYSDSGKHRKYYKINDAGKNKVERLRSERNLFNDTINKILNT